MRFGNINSLRNNPGFKITLKLTLQERNIFGHEHLQPPYKKLKNAGPRLFIQGVRRKVKKIPKQDKFLQRVPLGNIYSLRNDSGSSLLFKSIANYKKKSCSEVIYARGDHE